jgi:Cys-tRNA(Pro)/Cys-tRNA(Cys) deacylase
VPFSTQEYARAAKAESYGLEVAEKIGLDAGRVFKTLVVAVAGKFGVAVVPVPAQLDLKALGGKRSALARREAAERATGYVLRGISPLGQRKRLRVVFDASALAPETVHVRAGGLGLELELDPRDLIRLTNAEVRAIARA